MSMSFHARKARLLREAREVLRGHPDFREMFRSQMFKFAKTHKFKLDSMLNDPACIKVLTAEFGNDGREALCKMKEKALKVFAEKYQLIVNLELSFEQLREQVASIFEIELEEDAPEVDGKKTFMDKVKGDKKE